MKTLVDFQVYKIQLTLIHSVLIILIVENPELLVQLVSKLILLFIPQSYWVKR